MANLSIEGTTERSIFAAAVKPVKRLDVTQLVVERLQNLLEKGILEPGSKLPPEIEMTKLLGISRPSLRHAYKALNILGIIRAVPGDGTYINESTSKTLAMPLTFLMLMKKISLDEIFEFRMILECELANLAAQRRSDQEIQAIHAQLEIMARHLREDQTPQYIEAEYEFHNCIARAAHNHLLLEIIVIVSGLLWETRKRLVNLVPDRRKDFEQHRNVFLAISAQDPQAAGDSMRRHLQSALEIFKSEGGALATLSNREGDSVKS